MAGAGKLVDILKSTHYSTAGLRQNGQELNYSLQVDQILRRHLQMKRSVG